MDVAQESKSGRKSDDMGDPRSRVVVLTGIRAGQGETSKTNADFAIENFERAVFRRRPSQEKELGMDFPPGTRRGDFSGFFHGSHYRI